MHDIAYYDSPLGRILLAADEQGLIGLWFEEQKYYAAGLAEGHKERETSVLTETKHWLDAYFHGEQPEALPALHPAGTSFQREVWKILLKIPYGQVRTYGDIAAEIAKRRGQNRFSAQAVGGAVGHNRISILIPCHRVIGANGSLIGYAGGVERKLALLKLEGADLSGLTIPTRGTAL